ncbi:major facilitator superfamily protein [Hirsutella rhossiliensis]|uniref:Sugar transporter domain-containing protein n=1 Tax=Hirsutella rhossiliensis TaxID=111463 RepID=A0A9P8SN35_9HYPO|nr:sugar transporter domain-containing protein [Hirsutella rhossiliensis]KAH0966771.1 sugar transporter domain-containing protein [Hirsutella rhossiliensis]
MASSDPKAEAHFNVVVDDYDAKSMSDFSTTTESPGAGQHSSAARFKAIQDSIWLSQQSASSVKAQERARSGMTTEKRMTFFDCLRCYPKAVGWSLLLIATVIMEAYDKLLITGLFALPTFTRKYGDPLQSSGTAIESEISPTWQMALQNASILAEIVGLFAFGFVASITGYRPIMFICLAWICLAVFPAVFADNLETLLASQVLLGIPWGVIQTLAATYAAEVVPSLLRAFVLSNTNTCWLIGQLIGTGILRVSSRETTEWSFRFPFALQWAWALPLLVGVYFAPESPWWFIRHDKPEYARHALRRLSDQDELDIDNAIALMAHTNTVEKALQYDGTTYFDLFKGTNRRRTEIACMAWVCQALSGATLTSYGPYFFEQAGFNFSTSFTFSTIMYGVAVLGAILSWAFIPYAGRRTLYLAGLSSAVVLLTTGGIISVVLTGNEGPSWALGGLIVATTLSYNLTIGPVCYVLVAEVPATRLRLKTVALARIAYNLVTIINNILAPKMLNPTAWNLGGKACFVYATTALLCLVWCYFRLPETKKLSYLELDILFELKAPAPKFKQLQKKLDDSPYVSATEEERRTNPWHGWLAYS